MRKVLVPLGTLALLFGGASFAHADHSGNPNTENLAHVSTAGSGQAECGKATVLLTVPDGTPGTWQYGLTARIDGVDVGYTPVQTGPGSVSLPIVFTEDENDGSVTVEYYFSAATEWDLVAPDMNRSSVWPEVGEAFRSFDVDTDCVEPEPTEDPKPDPTTEPEPKDETPEPEPKDETPNPKVSDEKLPDTGAPLLPLVLAGVGLSGAGVLLRKFRN